MTVVFVTGGTGFLGMQMIKMLVQRGDHVRALHRSPKDAEKLLALGAHPVQGTLNDAGSLERLINGSEVVIHSAALFKMWAPKSDFEQTNVDGTRNTLRAAAKANVRSFVQIGASAVVMGKGRPMMDVNEDAPLTYPSWAPYIASKSRAENLVISANDPIGMKTPIILPPMIWGTGMPMLEGLAADVSAGQFAWPAGGHQLMSTSHVENVCHAALLAAERGQGGRAYFVTDGKNQTVRAVLGALLATRGLSAGDRSISLSLAWPMAILMELAWRTFNINSEPPLTRQMLRMIGYDFTLSDARARTELGYQPIISWEEGIRQMSAPKAGERFSVAA